MLSNNLQSMIDRRGQEVTLRVYTYGAYDPATGSTSSTSTDYTTKCYFSDYNLSELNKDSILMGDRQAALPALDTSGVALPEPDAEDAIIGVGDRMIIKAVQKIYNGGTLVCYICQVRG